MDADQNRIARMIVDGQKLLNSTDPAARAEGQKLLDTAQQLADGLTQADERLAREEQPPPPPNA